MQNNNNIVPPIAQLSYSMVEGLIQKVVQEELEEAIREQLATHNMTGEKGFLRNVVAKDIVNAYLGIAKNNIASQNTDVQKGKISQTLKSDVEKPLFSVTKNDNVNEPDNIEDSNGDIHPFNGLDNDK